MFIVRRLLIIIVYVWIRERCERRYQLYIEICTYKKRCVIVSLFYLYYPDILYICNVFLK